MMGDQSDQYVLPNQPPEIPPRRRLSAEVENLPYFNPDVRNMDDVREAMMPYLLQDGYFMLRSSFSKPGVFTVSIMHQRSIKHFNIGRMPHSFFLQDKHFSSITQLVQHYAHEDVPNLEGVGHIRLRYPIRYVPDQLSSVRATLRQTSSRPSLHVNVPTGKHRSEASVRRSASAAKSMRHEACETRKSNGAGNIGLCQGGERYVVRLPPRNGIPGRDRCRSDSTYDCQRSPVSQDHSNRLSGQHSASTNNVSPSFVYDKVRNVDVDRTSELISLLRLEESRGSAKCDCGLYEDESELPLGWSVHISHERQSSGRVFFMSPEGQTAWNLPLQVSLLLSAEQQDQIRKLLNGFRPDLAPSDTPGFNNYTNNNDDSRNSTAGAEMRRTRTSSLPPDEKISHKRTGDNHYSMQHAGDDNDDSDDVFD